MNNLNYCGKRQLWLQTDMKKLSRNRKQHWKNDDLDVPVSERSFARRFKERSVDYGMTYDKNISVENGRHCRGFRGVHVKVRTKDVNY